MNYSILTLPSLSLVRPKIKEPTWICPASPGSNHCTRLLAEELMHAMQRLYPEHAIVEVTGPLEVQSRKIWSMLGYSDSSANLDGRYTRWLDDAWSARSQMSALVPEALMQLKTASLWNDPIYKGVVLCLPGTVWRRDLRDRTHLGAPRQMDIWIVNKSSIPKMDRPELLHMMRSVVDVVSPTSRTVPSVIEAVHPYTQKGIEVSVPWQNTLLELLEAGEISPLLLQKVGLPDAHGLALGLGLDRGCMIRKRMLDIRGLVDEDPRAIAQCKTLAPWKKWTAYPVAKRDLSLAVSNALDAEQLVDAVASIVPESLLQKVDVLGTWPGEAIPLIAQKRLGIQKHQQQWLLRLELGWHDRTILTEEANMWAQQVWDTLHEGTAYEYRPLE